MATEAVQRPSLALLGAEPFRAAMEFAWYKLAKSGTPRPGDGHPVVIFPGLGAHWADAIAATPPHACRRPARRAPKDVLNDEVHR